MGRRRTTKTEAALSVDPRSSLTEQKSRSCMGFHIFYTCQTTCCAVEGVRMEQMAPMLQSPVSKAFWWTLSTGAGALIITILIIASRQQSLITPKTQTSSPARRCSFFITMQCFGILNNTICYCFLSIFIDVLKKQNILQTMLIDQICTFLIEVNNVH